MESLIANKMIDGHVNSLVKLNRLYGSKFPID
jgi:hypothetical protein